MTSKRDPGGVCGVKLSVVAIPAGLANPFRNGAYSLDLS